MADRREHVSMRDIYDAVSALRIEMSARIQRLEDEVDQLKAFQNKAVAIISAFSGVFTLAMTWVWNKVVGE